MKYEYGLFKQKRKKGDVWYFWYWDGPRRRNKSTGKELKWQAKQEAEKFLAKKKSHNTELRLRQYADPFYDWDHCPHIRRLLDERKTIHRRYARACRGWLKKYVFEDPIAAKPLAELTRADIIDFRSRLLQKLPDKINTVNKVMGTLKTVLKEAMIREDIERHPTFGVGNIKENRQRPGIFTLPEFQLMFPTETLGHWKSLQDHTCFLLAASTGMRRGEILALRWRDLELEDGFVRVERAWKDVAEEGLPKWENRRSVPFLLFKDRIISRLKELREASIRVGPDDLVFCYPSGERLGNTWWKNRFVAAMKNAEIDRVARRLSPHSFRHSLNTLLRDAGKDPAKIRQVLGWRQERVQDGYTHFDIEHFQDLRLDGPIR